MGAIPSRRIIARRLATPALLAGLLSACAGPAQAHPLYDTTRVLGHQGNACVGVNGLQGHRAPSHGGSRSVRPTTSRRAAPTRAPIS